VGSFKESDITDEEVIRLVIGRSLSAVFPKKEPYLRGAAEKPVLSARNLRCTGAVQDVSFEVWPGEVLGLAALQGMGQNELFHALFGDRAAEGGEIELDSRRLRFRSPADAIRAGIGLVPHERKNQGLFLGRSGRENVTLPSIDRFSAAGFINARQEAVTVDQFLARVNIHPSALYKHAVSLSGGNQQKLIIAKWLCTGSRVLLMLDPTRGIDVGTKYEVYRLIRDFVKEGRSAIFIYSSEIPELIGFCDRVLVMYQGSFTAELSGDELSEENIMSAMLGVKRRSGGGTGGTATEKVR
jgi:ribose transport system ATP-binding protein